MPHLSERLEFSLRQNPTTQATAQEDLGCSILGPTTKRIRAAQLSLRKALVNAPFPSTRAEAERLVQNLEQTQLYAALCDDKKRISGRAKLRDEVVFPLLKKRHLKFLHLRDFDAGIDIEVSPDDIASLNDFFEELGAASSIRQFSKSVKGTCAKELLKLLKEADFLREGRLTQINVPTEGIVFIGHNTFLFSSEKTRILVDPYFRPVHPLDMNSYRPMQMSQLSEIDAVVITHTHGDHLHLGSLLWLPKNTPIFVPKVEKQSLFSTQSATYLHEMGFTRVTELEWNASTRIKNCEITAFPFYGEQSTTEEGVYKNLFNQGNTYHISSASFSAAFFADSGRCVRGNMRDVSKNIRAQKQTELLCCGTRSFRLKPLSFAQTTLETFLVNVPLEHIFSEQHLMADANDALEYAEILGCRYLVPCADGGAPWYWREGMGPKYPWYLGTPFLGASHDVENEDADPFPERVIEVVNKKRSEVTPLLMRPGDIYSWREKRLQLTQRQWPGSSSSSR